MMFSLEIRQLISPPGGEETEEVVGSYPAVEITYFFEADSTAIALREGEEVARLSTFDDSPVTIHEDHIKIEGVVEPEANEPKTEFGTWILRERQ